jgi:phosphosulfolactate synthase
MNFNLPFLPERSQKPRDNGITIMTDRGLSVREAENFTEGNVPYTDFVKMAFGTSLLIPSLESKLNIYHEAGIIPWFGGTLFEVFAYRKSLEEYVRYLDKYGIEYMEVSDGTVRIERKRKLEYIRQFSSNYKVISQTTNSLPEGHLSFERWLDFAAGELEAGAQYLIIKESVQMPVYGKDGLASFLVNNPDKISFDSSKIIWDAPKKTDQIELIGLLGNNVNLCNIPHYDVLALEAKRLGLHSSTLLKLIQEGNDNDETHN